MKIEGAPKMSSAHHEQIAYRIPLIRAGSVIGPAQRHWKLYGLICFLMLSEACFEAF